MTVQAYLGSFDMGGGDGEMSLISVASGLGGLGFFIDCVTHLLLTIDHWAGTDLQKHSTSRNSSTE